MERMNWMLSEDRTEPIITAQKHIASSHGGFAGTLPETCVVFEIGMALGYLKSKYRTKTLCDRLPCFLENPVCLSVKEIPNVCFTRGGYGAPAAVDTLETVRALGVRRVIVVGMCGGFSPDFHVGDVVIPSRCRCEEGTSFHYCVNPEYAAPDQALFERAVSHYSGFFCVHTDDVVTSDAVYRQTPAKEALWRETGAIGVDMESSALLSVSRYYNMPAVSILLCSDRHPVPGESGDWQWGKKDFKQQRENFVRQAVTFAARLAD